MKLNEIDTIVRNPAYIRLFLWQPTNRPWPRFSSIMNFLHVGMINVSKHCKEPDEISLKYKTHKLKKNIYIMHAHTLPKSDCPSICSPSSLQFCVLAEKWEDRLCMQRSFSFSKLSYVR